MYILFFFYDTTTTEIYTLSLHDALPILSAIIRNNRDYLLENIQPNYELIASLLSINCITDERSHFIQRQRSTQDKRSEEHTSELQSQSNRVCRLLLEKKKNNNSIDNNIE